MTQIRLIALDMDGTLLDDDHATVPARNVAALRRAAERGAAVAIASGRAWDLLHEVAAQLDMLHYAVLSNGAAVLDVTSGEWLWRKGLPRAQSRRLIELLLARDVPFEVYADGENYIQADRSGRVLARALSPEFASVLRRYSRFPEDLNAALEGAVWRRSTSFTSRRKSAPRFKPRWRPPAPWPSQAPSGPIWS